MANNTRIAELQKKFKGNEKAAPTPESQFGMLKKSKEEQAKAVRIAKARAARYNMTLRSLAIQTTQDVSKMQRADRDAKVETAKRAAKYNMTSRALPVSTVVSKKDQENLGKALADEVSPTIAKEVLTAVAKKTNDEHLEATAKSIAAPEPKKPVKVEKENVKEEFKVEGTPKATRTARAVSNAEGKEEKRGKQIVMEGLGEALSSGDEDAINKAILKSFLESSAPHLVGQVDKLIDTYKSHMQDLFDKLIKTFPDPHDAEINGRNKADKEVAEAIESTTSPKQPAKAVVQERVPEKVSEVKKVPEKSPEVKKAPEKVPEVKKAPEKVPEVKKAPEAVVDVKKEVPQAGKDDDENSLGMYPEDMPDMSDDIIDPTPVEKSQNKRVVFDEIDDLDAGKENKNKDDDIADDDSLVIDQDAAFNAGYEDVIKKAEESPETQIKKSVTRRGSVQRIDQELTNELETTYKETPESKRKSVQSIVSISSIAQIDEPTVLEGGYIVAAELKEDEKEDVPVSRWAVQLQGKNFALRQKLIKQGLSKQQVDDLVENLESNTSEML